jgi:predicted DNA-binding transcriptional regulator AlpA
MENAGPVNITKKEQEMEYTIAVDVDLLKKMYIEEINKQLDIIEKESLLIDMKELCEIVKLSRPTVEKIFLKDPNFPAIRVNSKWIFNRKDVNEFLKDWSKKRGSSNEQ